MTIQQEMEQANAIIFHINDLVYGHLKALNNIEELENFNVFNLGTGKSTTVYELVTCMQKRYQ